MNYRIQIDEVVRDATPEEAEKIQFQKDATASQAEQLRSKLQARQTARTKLSALGLTEAEVAAIIGA